jgi:ABC-type phosphate/phosphonate transport system substrate-binding protein
MNKTLFISLLILGALLTANCQNNSTDNSTSNSTGGNNQTNGTSNSSTEVLAENSLAFLDDIVSVLSPYSDPSNVSDNLAPFLDGLVNMTLNLNNLGVIMANKNTTSNSILNMTMLT